MARALAAGLERVGSPSGLAAILAGSRATPRQRSLSSAAIYLWDAGVAGGAACLGERLPGVPERWRAYASSCCWRYYLRWLEDGSWNGRRAMAPRHCMLRNGGWWRGGWRAGVLFTTMLLLSRH
jgi:hypothetical protein